MKKFVTSVSSRSLRLLLAVALVVMPLHGWALPVTGLYSHRVAVANESDGERNRAFREAFEAVVLKVTGDPRWLEHAAVQSAAANAQSYVEAISYTSQMVPVEQVPQEATPDNQGDAVNGQADTSQLDENLADQQPANPVPTPTEREQRFINVDFAQNLINQMLVSADIPIWDNNRPSVLVWMVLQDPGGQRTMLTADGNPEIISIMQDFAQSRGLPIIFPVLDFEDRRALSEDQVWALETDAIRQASARYGADSMLAGRVYFTAAGQLVGLWQFIFQDQVEMFDGVDTSLQSYLNAPLNRITSNLAAYFAITPEAALREKVLVRVDGVDNISEYSALLAYVRNLGLVESVATTALDGERIELTLSLIGNAMQLNELIALDRGLLPVGGAVAPDSGLLHYRWTR
jgi:hypothetical protein